MASAAASFVVHSTAGAVPVKNEKGELYMQKVKVHRYVAGKRPEFAGNVTPESMSEEEQEDKPSDRFPVKSNLIRSKDSEQKEKPEFLNDSTYTPDELADPRVLRLIKKKREFDIADSSSDEDELDRVARHKRDRGLADESDASDKRSDDEDLNQEMDEGEIEKRRELIRIRASEARSRQEESLLDEAPIGDGEEELLGISDEEEEEEDEYTSSEDEMAPKLKPVFVRKRDRITLKEKQKADQITHEAELEAKRLADERRKDTLKLVEAEIRREQDEARAVEEACDAIDSDEGQGDPVAEQEEYEKWKVRELRRIRRDKEARENIQQEKEEIERIRNMNDIQRQEEFRKNPKLITNKAIKGKYKFMQKYFHRGAFFVTASETDVYKRDFAQPTLEDHFDKTKLPAVMQVKNFGLAGRTKYTHLVDQDTSTFDSPWFANTMTNIKFHELHGGGVKSVFEKPLFKSKKKTDA